MAKMENGKNSRPESRIPVPSPAPLRRSGSLRLGGCPPIQEHRSDVVTRPKLNRHRSLQSLNTASSFSCEQDDDVDSVRSFSSTASVCSNLSQCDHAHFARNGTTYSGRCKRYVVHCSPHSTETDDYLTPTQRTNRTIRKLRNLLKEAQEELADKDKEILRLTKEVVELRLLKVDSGNESIDVDGNTENPSSNTAQADNRVTRCELLTSSPHPGYCSSPPLAQSLSDSGHFEDLNSSKELSAHGPLSHSSPARTLESLQRRHEDEIRELKERHNDKVDSLLQRITDVNDRYYALRPLYEDCKEKLHELEKLNEELKKDSCQSHLTKIAELVFSNEELTQDKQALVAEVEELSRLITELKKDNLNHDKLEVENMQLKNREGELLKIISDSKEKTCQTCCKDECSQTENFELQHLCNGHVDETDHTNESCEQSNQCSYKAENFELKTQITAHAEKIKQMEEQQQKEKDIYVQLYKKGIQAAKLLDNEELESEQTQENENSLIPDLLQKLRIKQEELDNLKAMYRRLLEARKEQPKHDPEMTLQFLKSAFYYFLTDRENCQGHLAAIESILGFTDNEKINIERAFLWR